MECWRVEKFALTKTATKIVAEAIRRKREHCILQKEGLYLVKKKGLISASLQ